MVRNRASPDLQRGAQSESNRSIAKSRSPQNHQSESRHINVESQNCRYVKNRTTQSAVFSIVRFSIQNRRFSATKQLTTAATSPALASPDLTCTLQTLLPACLLLAEHQSTPSQGAPFTPKTTSASSIEIGTLRQGVGDLQSASFKENYTKQNSPLICRLRLSWGCAPEEKGGTTHSTRRGVKQIRFGKLALLQLNGVVSPKDADFRPFHTTFLAGNRQNWTLACKPCTFLFFRGIWWISSSSKTLLVVLKSVKIPHVPAGHFSTKMDQTFSLKT